MDELNFIFLKVLELNCKSNGILKIHETQKESIGKTERWRCIKGVPNNKSKSSSIIINTAEEDSRLFAKAGLRGYIECKDWYNLLFKFLVMNYFKLNNNLKSHLLIINNRLSRRTIK
ncbi:hypothetical protein BpHYR1_013543 [Brachionus plicatilis]|uniref:Uncharacterized protein n=1 Tax=Brachionus plicatilis TaxID=10195 RepID=A0A3M7SEL4_BRAPC|nr:hypothetical protein BpHYR1_013543 [Brachionus plicatilis]